MFGLLPNYRSRSAQSSYQPITPKEKLKIALDESFDRGTLVLAGVFAAEAQLKKSDLSYGQGLKGYGRYYAANYADLVLSDFMTAAVYPTLLHQDPRYFRRGSGSHWSRLGYAMGQIFWTHTDSGGRQFNYSEIAGNATAVAFSSAYHPDGRDAGSAVSKLGSWIGLDMVSNILKEFLPDLLRKRSRERNAPGSSQPVSLDRP